MELLAVLTIVVFVYFFGIFSFRFGFANNSESFIFQLENLVLLELTNLLWWWRRKTVAPLSSSLRLFFLVLGLVLPSFSLRSFSALSGRPISSFSGRSVSSFSRRSASLTITSRLVRPVTVFSSSSTSAITFLLFSLTILLSCLFSFLSRLIWNDRSRFLLNNHFRSLLSYRFRLLLFDNGFRLRSRFNFRGRFFGFHFRQNIVKKIIGNLLLSVGLRFILSILFDEGVQSFLEFSVVCEFLESIADWSDSTIESLVSFVSLFDVSPELCELVLLSILSTEVIDG